MLAGGIVEPGIGRAGAVSAYVAVRAPMGKSRVFKVRGRTDDPYVCELDAATTVDLGRFRREVMDDLQPEIAHITGLGGTAAVAEPKPEWVAALVRRHLRGVEGAEVD